MNTMRNLLRSRIGFTLVELMVVVVVLGILAGIAVQRMGDVRDRTETAVEEANARLLLGAANLAKVNNYMEYMYFVDATNPERNLTIRWQRPCEGVPVVQAITQAGFLITGYNYITTEWSGDETEGLHWNPTQDWDLTTYVESFPVGYAVEIIYPSINEDGEVIEGENYGGIYYGYNNDNSVYDEEQIIVYKLIGDVGEYDAEFKNTEGQLGYNYQEQSFDPDDWRQIHPLDS